MNRPDETMELLVHRGRTGYGPYIYFDRNDLYDESKFLNKCKLIRRALIILNNDYKGTLGTDLFSGNVGWLNDGGLFPAEKIIRITENERHR